MRAGERDGRDLRIGVMGRDAQGLGDVGLRRAAPRLKDVAPALGLTDALQTRRRSGARPGAGRLGQGANLSVDVVTWARGGTVPGANGHGSRWSADVATDRPARETGPDHGRLIRPPDRPASGRYTPAS